MNELTNCNKRRDMRTRYKAALWSLGVIALILAAAGGYLYFAWHRAVEAAEKSQPTEASGGLELDPNLAAISPKEAKKQAEIRREAERKGDTATLAELDRQAAVRDSAALRAIDSLSKAPAPQPQKLAGAKVIIAVTGVDSRLGTASPHADANHVLKIWLDSGVVEIISVPRGANANAGYPAESGLNYLANVLANRGRSRYLSELARLSGVGKIDYYVEFGFSQAIALLQLMGFKNDAVQTLRMLRSRKSFQTGDYQRSFNQGQFISRMLTTKFRLLDGLLGEAILRGALLATETNLTYPVAKDIYNRLKASGFPRAKNSAFVRLKPKLGRAQEFDMANEQTRDSLYKRVVGRSAKAQPDIRDGAANNSDMISNRVSKTLKQAVAQANKEIKRNPKSAARRLEAYFNQRAWWQVSSESERESIRKSLCETLAEAYYLSGSKERAAYVRQALDSEEKLRGEPEADTLKQ